MTRDVAEVSLAVAMVSLLVAALTIVISVAVARIGWQRDQLARDRALQAECARSLCALVQARVGPLSTVRNWDLFEGMAANEHHVAAIAAMLSVSASRRDDDFVRTVAVQAFSLQEECMRYRQSPDYAKGQQGNELGLRRAALANAAALMQDDILTWQRDGSRHHLKSFWSHYAGQLLKDPS